MNETVDHSMVESFSLSPEQRAVLSMAREDASDGGGMTHLLQIEIGGLVDAQRLHDAVLKVVRIHDVLRHSFLQVHGFLGLRQQGSDTLPSLSWQQADLRGRDDAALTQWLDDFGRTALAIERGEALRCALIRTAEARWTLALAICALAADGTSLQTLYNQIAAAYAGEGPPGRAAVFQYSHFVEWRQGLEEEGDEARAGREHWARHLRDAQALGAPRLPHRRDGTHEAGRHREHRLRELDAGSASRITTAAAALGTNAETLMHATWWALLARIAGGKRFVGGWQHDCRRDYEPMHGAVGVFDKVLPIVVDLALDETFSGWLARLAGITQAHVDAQEHWPVDAPPLSAHLAVGFVFADAAQTRGADPVWRLRQLPPPMPNFELALQVACGEGGMRLSVHVDPLRYTRLAADRLLDQYLTLLDAVTGQPASSRVASLALVGAAERDALLSMNAGSEDFGKRTVAGHIARWAELTPHAPAIESGDRSLSYAQLIAQADRMAAWMRTQGVGMGDLVALNLPRSMELLVAMLAAWRIGAGYLPLEPEWPAARRDAVLADARPALVLHGEPPIDDAAPAPRAWRTADLSDIAYVLYTSGSTGAPKGVVIEQGQLLNYVAAASQAMKLETARRWALTGSVAADLGNTALFGALFNGACLVIASKQDMQDGASFARFMSERGIDGLKIVPSHLEALLEGEAACLPRKLVLGGEAAPRSLIERIARLAPDGEVYNHYGPTETTVGVMVHAVDASTELPQVLPLSTVLANNRVHVLDDRMQLAASGTVGELYVGGKQLCRCYLNSEVDGAFVADPFRPGERLYRTGDLACVLPEGGLRLLGRADHQVKVRGFRVEPAEIEAALLAQPGVRHAVVMPTPTDVGGLELVAFLVADAHTVSDPGQQALRDRLAATLPAHMLPVRHVFVREFARLANGKIDRLALADLAANAAGRPSPPPRDAVEFVLADGMSRLLGRDAIGVDDDFFELGGHSLLVIKLVARIRKLLKVEIAPGVVFDHPNAAALAAALRGGGHDVQSMERLALLQQQLAALTPGQRSALEACAREGSTEAAATTA